MNKWVSPVTVEGILNKILIQVLVAVKTKPVVIRESVLTK